MNNLDGSEVVERIQYLSKQPPAFRFAEALADGFPERLLFDKLHLNVERPLLELGLWCCGSTRDVRNALRLDRRIRLFVRTFVRVIAKANQREPPVAPAGHGKRVEIWRGKDIGRDVSIRRRICRICAGYRAGIGLAVLGRRINIVGFLEPTLDVTDACQGAKGRVDKEHTERFERG